MLYPENLKEIFLMKNYKQRFGYPNNKKRRDNYKLLKENGFNSPTARRVRDFKEEHLFLFILYNSKA